MMFLRSPHSGADVSLRFMSPEKPCDTRRCVRSERVHVMRVGLLTGFVPSGRDKERT
jgi:hypothetical protein